MAGAGKTPDMPDKGPLAYVAPLWGEMGRSHSNGFGIQPIPFTEIEAFARMESLTAQEAKLIRSMSTAYVSGLARGKDVFAIPPWEGPHG